jgi:hypothetical protein
MTDRIKPSKKAWATLLLLCGPFFLPNAGSTQEDPEPITLDVLLPVQLARLSDEEIIGIADGFGDVIVPVAQRTSLGAAAVAIVVPPHEGASQSAWEEWRSFLNEEDTYLTSSEEEIQAWTSGLASVLEELKRRQLEGGEKDDSDSDSDSGDDPRSLADAARDLETAAQKNRGWRETIARLAQAERETPG